MNHIIAPWGILKRESISMTAGITAPATESVEEYIDRAVALVLNENYRSAAGNAGRVFTETFCRDEKRFAEDVTRHIEEVIDDVRAKSKG